MITFVDGKIYRNGLEVQEGDLTRAEKRTLRKLKKASNPSTGANVTTPAQGSATTNFSSPETVVTKSSQKLFIKSLISGYQVKLEGIFSDIQMNWNLNWNEENVYGRIDPIPTYSGTTRDISLSMEMITPEASAVNDLNANIPLANLQLLQIIANMCYPGYDINPDEDLTYNSATLKAAPLVAIKMKGVIQNSQGDALKAYMKSFSITHQAKGLFELGVGTGDDSPVFYKRLTVNFTFGILHDENVGHRSDGRPFDTQNRYPFGNPLAGEPEEG